MRVYDPTGGVVARFEPDDRRSIIGNARFFSGDPQILLAEANPFLLYVIDLRTREKTLWTEGFRQKPPDGLHGPCKLRVYGNGFLVSTYDGLYQSPGLLEPWQPLTEELLQEDYFAGYFCRDLQPHQPRMEQWIVARNAGIYLMSASPDEELVYEDVAVDLDLIDAMLPFRDHYFVSFHRHRNGKMGVRLSHDFQEAKVLTLNNLPASSISEKNRDGS